MPFLPLHSATPWPTDGVRVAADFKEGYAVTAGHSVQQYDPAAGYVVSPQVGRVLVGRCCRLAASGALPSGALPPWLGRCSAAPVPPNGHGAASLASPLLYARFSNVACDLTFDSCGVPPPFPPPFHSPQDPVQQRRLRLGL